MYRIPTAALLMFSSFWTASCNDTVEAQRPWETSEPPPAAPNVTATTPDDEGVGPDDGDDDAFGDGTEPPPGPSCDLSECGDVPPCQQAVCGDDGSCKLAPAPPGTSCEDGDFCTVQSACDGRGACDSGFPATMYVTVNDSVRVADVLEDGRMLLVGATLEDRWRQVALMLDPTGALLWRRFYGQTTRSGMLSDAMREGEGWLFAGHDGTRLTVSRVDRDGRAVWTRAIGGAEWVGYPRLARAGSAVFLAGTQAAPADGAHGMDTWLRRIDPEDGRDVWVRDLSTPDADRVSLLLGARESVEAVVQTSHDDGSTTQWSTAIVTATADGRVERRELFEPSRRRVLWGDRDGESLDLVVEETVETDDGYDTRIVLDRLPDDGPRLDVATLAEGELTRASVTTDNRGRIVLVRAGFSPQPWLLVERWDRAGNRIDPGFMGSPTGDPIGPGWGLFLDDDTFVASGPISVAQSGYAWSRSGTVIRRARPFHSGTCAVPGRTGQTCLLAEEDSCFDDNPCTADLCNAETGCEYRPMYDGMPCGAGGACQTGECIEP